MHVSFRNDNAILYDSSGAIVGVMVAEKLVYECPGRRIEDKYAQQHDSQYSI